MPKPILGEVKVTGEYQTPGTEVTLEVRVKHLGEPRLATIRLFERDVLQYEITSTNLTTGLNTEGREILTIGFEVPHYTAPSKQEGGEELEITVENGDGNEGSTIYP